MSFNGEYSNDFATAVHDQQGLALQVLDTIASVSTYLAALVDDVAVWQLTSDTDATTLLEEFGIFQGITVDSNNVVTLTQLPDNPIQLTSDPTATARSLAAALVSTFESLGAVSVAAALNDYANNGPQVTVPTSLV
jgi:hypothetical protein